jgi:hypothetical protein
MRLFTKKFCDCIINIVAIGGKVVRNWWMRDPCTKAQPCTMRPHYILSRTPTSEHHAENLAWGALQETTQ